MQDHLSDEQLIARIEGTTNHDAAAHAERCAECRAEEETLQAAVGEWSAQVRDAGGRPAGFWYAQASAIRRRQAIRETAQRLTWAAAVVTVALAVTLALEPNRPAPPRIQSDPDHDLLVAVQQSVRRPLPRALEPASLLAEDLSKTSQTSTRR